MLKDIPTNYSKTFCSKHRRLEGIELKGARNSKLSQCHPQIFLLPPQFLKTFEKTLKKGKRGTDFTGEIDFGDGWNGAPIVVGAFNREIHNQISSGLINGPALLKQLTKGDLGVLDGNHRKAESERKTFKYVPVQLFDMEHKSLVLGTWLDGYKPLTVREYSKRETARTTSRNWSRFG